MPNAVATFDFLFVADGLAQKLGWAATGEIHLFAYLSCLLSLFDGRPVTDWGYAFTGLDSGSPFSSDIQEAGEQLQMAGMLYEASEGILLSDHGAQQLGTLKELQLFRGRTKYLNSACSSLLAFPVGTVRNAMSMEPGLRPAISSGGARRLLTETALTQLYEHFHSLFLALGTPSDLLVPATVWLKYLSERSENYDKARLLGSPSKEANQA